MRSAPSRATLGAKSIAALPHSCRHESAAAKHVRKRYKFKQQLFKLTGHVGKDEPTLRLHEQVAERHHHAVAEIVGPPELAAAHHAHKSRMACFT